MNAIMDIPMLEYMWILFALLMSQMSEIVKFLKLFIQIIDYGKVIFFL